MKIPTVPLLTTLLAVLFVAVESAKVESNDFDLSFDRVSSVDNDGYVTSRIVRNNGSSDIDFVKTTRQKLDLNFNDGEHMRRQNFDEEGSGDYDDDNENDEDYDEYSGEVESVDTTTATTVKMLHPHRHHHGEDLLTTVETVPQLPTNVTSKTIITSTESYFNSSTDSTSPKTITSTERTVSVTDFAEDDANDDDEKTVTNNVIETEEYDDNADEEWVTMSNSWTVDDTVLRSTQPTDSPNIDIEFDREAPEIAVFTNTTVDDNTDDSIIPTTLPDDFTTADKNVTAVYSSDVPTTMKPAVDNEHSDIITQETTVGIAEDSVKSNPFKESSTMMNIFTASTTITTTTTAQVAIFPLPTEQNVYQRQKSKPYIENRLQQLSVTAGKEFRFVIPLETFKDTKDGYNLTLTVLTTTNLSVNSLENMWCRFNRSQRELYGLPFERDVSKWEFLVTASNQEGGLVQDTLTIHVQQHKLQRVVNHEFSIQFNENSGENSSTFVNYVDWSLKVLHALGRLYNSTMTEITVRQVNISAKPALFVWTNDSLPTAYCPTDEIRAVFAELVAMGSQHQPSDDLLKVLRTEFTVVNVSSQGLGVCNTLTKPPVAVSPPVVSRNFSPFVRNPIDQINATVGELLIFKVPDDTFYDPENTDSRVLNVTLLIGNRQPIPANNWLQFDSRNREFYGIPQRANRTEYQLVCEDTTGLFATDSLVVVVHPPVNTPYNAEFTMILDVAYSTFANSATIQKKFVRQLQALFGESINNSLHFKQYLPKYPNATIVTWHNKSLATTHCPRDDIKAIEGILLSTEARNQFDFAVTSIEVSTKGSCTAEKITAAAATTSTLRPNSSPNESSTTLVATETDEYLMTFIIPAVIIACMLTTTALAACFFYRHRRLGKLHLQDEEESHHVFGNKGIPVIFQEELEESSDEGTKQPIILKDEKPPLSAVNYACSAVQPLLLKKANNSSTGVSLTETGPYQPPPPPFIYSSEQINTKHSNNRIKTTPTYRKPPPYVPP